MRGLSLQARPSGIGKCSRTLGMSRGLGKGYLLSLALEKEHAAGANYVEVIPT